MEVWTRCVHCGRSVKLPRHGGPALVVCRRRRCRKAAVTQRSDPNDRARHAVSVEVPGGGVVGTGRTADHQPDLPGRPAPHATEPLVATFQIPAGHALETS